MNEVLARVEKIINEKCGDSRGKERRFSRLTLISYTTIHSWFEKDSRPSWESLFKISEATGATMSWLVTGKEGELNVRTLDDKPGIPAKPQLPVFNLKTVLARGNVMKFYLEVDGWRYLADENAELETGNWVLHIYENGAQIGRILVQEKNIVFWPINNGDLHICSDGEGMVRLLEREKYEKL